MKKIISFALVLTFVLAMFTCGFAEEPAKIPGVAHYTGAWEVIDDGKGIKALDSGSILVLEKTAASGTLEFTLAYNEVVKANKWPAVFFQGTGFENVAELGDPAIEQATTDSVYCWLRQANVTITNMTDGQYKDPRPDGKPAHQFVAYADTVGADWESMTEYTFKIEFGNGTVQAYINGVAAASTFAYEATGNQIAFRGKAIKNDAGEVTSSAIFSNVKVNGEEVLFVEKPTQTGDATVIAVAAVSFAVLACGAVLTISKKRIAE